MFNKITKEIQYGRDTVILETGQIARQATAAVMVRIGATRAISSEAWIAAASSRSAITTVAPSRAKRCAAA